MRVIHYLIIILFTPILLLINFRFLIFSHNFYEAEFKKLGVYENFSSPEIADFEAKQLINYYCCDGSLSSTFYSSREIAHLIDVKNLIALMNVYLYVLIWTLITCLIYIFHKKQYKFSASYLGISALVTIISIFALWLTSKLHFDSMFMSFHKLTFDNNYWLLSSDANLIKLFPPQFFVDFANQVAIQTVTMAALVLIITHAISSKNASKKP